MSRRNMRITKRELQSLIKEAVLNVVDEGKFNPTTLSSMDNTYDSETRSNPMIDYVKNKVGLRYLGAGSSRAVFVLDSKRALKIAIKPAGVGQNQAELDATTDSASNALVAKVLQYDPEFKWLVSELVKPLTDHKEF